MTGLSVLIEVFWKSGAALGAALCISGLLRHRSADVRRLVLSTAVVATLIAILSVPLLPRWTTVAPAWLQWTSAEVTPASPLVIPASSGAVSTDVRKLRATVTPDPNPAPGIRNRIPGAIPLIWFFGTTLLLARFVTRLFGLRRLRNMSHCVSDATLENVTGITLLENSTVAAPVTWGFIRPVILLPAGFGQLPAECRSAVLCHELAHIQGYDFFLRSLTEVACALLWFQPLIWIAARRLREEQELACDNRVLAAGGKPSAYARLLLDWDLRPGLDPSVAVGMAHRSCLKRRLYSLLDREQRRDQVTRPAVLITGLLGLAMAFPLAAISLTSAPASQAKMPERAPAIPQPRIQLAQNQTAPPVPRPSADQPPPAAMFVASSSLIVEHVIVTGQDGMSVEGLTADDFAVTEDENQMRVTFIEYQKLDDPRVRSYYVVAYYTYNNMSDTYRTVKIELKNSSARLDYRAGYYSHSMMPAGVYDRRPGLAGVTPPAVLSKVEPEYTDQARKAKYSGTVALNVDVDASGKPANIRVLRPLGMGLDEKAIEAVTRWRFRPGTKDGEPATVPVRVEVLFQLL